MSKLFRLTSEPADVDSGAFDSSTQNVGNGEFGFHVSGDGWLRIDTSAYSEEPTNIEFV